MNQLIKILFSLFICCLFSCGNDYPKGEINNSKRKKEIKHTKLTNVTQEISTKNSLKISKLITNINVTKKLTDYGDNNKEHIVASHTKYGVIRIRLYKDTPLHRANFIMLIKKGFFNNTLFYRVIRNFMIQGGNSDRDNIFHKMAKIGNYRIPSEIKPNHLHKRGALSMAVQEQYFKDPKKFNKNSSPYNFFIVQKGKISDEYMDRLEKIYSIKINEPNRSIYRKYGGNPHLDGDYTVFGEVIKGMKVVDQINTVLTDAQDRPIENIYIKIKIVE
jgi:peptidyl-prolyl cis-trans isomerase B (cyclophilin B)